MDKEFTKKEIMTAFYLGENYGGALVVMGGRHIPLKYLLRGTVESMNITTELCGDHFGIGKTTADEVAKVMRIIFPESIKQEASKYRM